MTLDALASGKSRRLGKSLQSPKTCHGKIRSRLRGEARLSAEEPQYSKLAARLLLGTIVKEVSSFNLYSFSQSIAYGYQEGVVSRATAEFVQTHARKLNHAIDDSLSDLFEYFGLRT